MLNIIQDIQYVSDLKHKNMTHPPFIYRT